LMFDFKFAPAVSAVLNASWELRTVLNEGGTGRSIVDNLIIILIWCDKILIVCWGEYLNGS
jgi:hypothetical protein